MTVRLAAPSDIDGIRSLLLLDSAETGVDAPSLGAITALLEKAASRSEAVAGVIEANGTVVASVGLSLVNIWYSDDFILRELWCFVHPEHRKTTYAKQLIAFAKLHADTLGVPLVMGLRVTAGVEGKRRLYEREMKPAGAFFVHEPEVGADALISKRVRIAGPEYVHAIADFCDWIGGANALTAVNYQRAKNTVLDYVLNGRDPVKGGIAGVIGTPEHIDAMVLLRIQPSNFADGLHLVEHFLGARPDAKDPSLAKEMITFATNIANMLKLPLDIGVLSRERAPAKARLWRQILGAPVQQVFLYEGK